MPEDKDLRVVRCYAQEDLIARDVVCDQSDLAFVIAALFVTRYRRIAIYTKAAADVEALADQIQETQPNAPTLPKP